MKIFSQYKGLGKGNFILFFGKIVTNLGAMIWPMMTLILNGKLGLDATQTALFFIITGFMFLPANIWGGQLADRFSKKKIIILCDIVSITGAFLADRVSTNYRGRIYGITSFSAAFMTGIVEWNSGWLFDYYGSAPAWIFSVAMTMIAVIASFVLIFTDKKEFADLYR